RYIESIEEDIPQDVDAHLFGGIPRSDIDNLKVLQSTVPDVLEKSLKEIRNGYFELSNSIDEITKDVLNDTRIMENSKEMEEKVTAYLNKYWKVLKKVEDVNQIADLRDEMLTEIKAILSEFNHVDTYDGYQIIAEIWKNTLADDTEIIAASDFYTAGRTRVPNMVTKGSGKKKRVEQDGWIGSIIPNEFITKHLYSDKLAEIETKQKKLQEVETELADLVEAAKVEDSEEEGALGEVLNEKEDAFLIGSVRAELKEVKKDTTE